MKRNKYGNPNHGAYRDQIIFVSRLQDYKMAANTRSRDKNAGIYKFWRQNYVRLDNCCLQEINKKNKVVHLKRIKLHTKCSENTRKSKELSTCKKCSNCGHTEMLTQNLQTNLQTKNVTKRTYKWLCKMLQRRCGDVDWSENKCCTQGYNFQDSPADWSEGLFT